MAIVQTGTTQTFSGMTGANSGTVSSTITVPSDAEIVVVGWSGADGSGVANFFSAGGMTFTKGGADTAMTYAGGDSATTARWSAPMFYLVLPDTGSNKTLKWDWFGTGTSIDGFALCSVTFWKGIDTSSPVRGTGTGGSDTGVPYTSSSITALTGDLIVAWVGGYGGSLEATIDSWSNLTLLTQVAFDHDADGAWATGSPTGNTTVAASTATNFQDGTIVGISLKPAAATFVPSNPQRAIAVGVAAGWPAPLVPPFLARRLVPPPTGPVISNPPLIGARVPLPVQISWIPPPPPLIVAKPLTPPSAPISFIPIGVRVPASVLEAWLPPLPRPIVARNLNPPINGPSIDNPPVLGARVPLAVQVAWIPPPPAPIVAINLNPPIAGPPVDKPPIIGEVTPLAALVAWIPPPPAPIVARNLNPPISGPTPTDPPIVGARVPLPVSIAWIPPPPAPIVAINLNPPVSGPTPDNPPIVGARAPLAVSVAWIPPPPMPIVIDNLVPPISGPSTDNPPILGARIPLAVQVAWIPPPPMPIVAINLNPPINGPPVDDPPFVGRARLPEDIAPPLPYDLLVRRQGIPQTPVVASYLSPNSTPEAIYLWWQQAPFVAQLPRNLTPPISAPDNPPFAATRPMIWPSVEEMPYDLRVRRLLTPPDGPTANPVPFGVQVPEAILNSWFAPPVPMSLRGSTIAPLLPAPVVVNVNFTSFLLMGVG